MRYSFFKQSFSFFLCCCIAVSAVLIPQDANAVFKDVRSPIDWNSGSNRCNTGTIAFDPFGSNRDIEWELTNPVCSSLLLGTIGATLVTAQLLSTYGCNPETAAAETTILLASVAAGVMLSPKMVTNRAKEATKCTRLLGTCAAAAGASPDCGLAAVCCSFMTATLIATATAVAAVASIWEVSKQTYEKAGICGREWQSWSNVVDPVTNKAKWVKGKGSYQKCVQQIFQNNGVLDAGCTNTLTSANTLDGTAILTNGGAAFFKDISDMGAGAVAGDLSRMNAAAADIGSLGAIGNAPGISTAMSVSNLYYREYIYGGKEKVDNGPNACDLPSSWDNAKRDRILGYHDGNQRYYMTGPGSAPVFACYRFQTVDRNDNGAQIAYDCCKKRSQNVVCVENQVDPFPVRYTFCEIGSSCTIAPVTFQAYASRKQSNYGCIKTYSLCPYNHILAGGTEEKKVKDDDTTQIENFCQFMNHCSKLPIMPYIRTTTLDGGFISSACKDMKGDSQNTYGYTSELVPVNSRGFSAPIIQCFKETMENIFLNKAGDSQCLNPQEYPATDGTCISGYVFRKGYDLPTKSFFLKVQDGLQAIIKMALSISVLFFGAGVLLGSNKIGDKKVLLMYVLKIGLVMYFAVGDAWQASFMKGVLGTSGFLADLTFKVDESAPTNKLDGCQFPRYDYSKVTSTDEGLKYENPSYPPEKDYLRPWDTLDCKIARALGFGPEVSVPNLVMMIVGGFFTGGLGIIFFVGAFVFAFFLIAMTIRAIHIFLISITSVVILIYVSPITITCSMFSRTKGIFDGWLKQLLGFTLQPMILFAYLAIMVTLFDKMVIGDDVTFSPSTAIINGEIVTDNYGRSVPKRINCAGAANDTSIYCIFRVSDIQTFNGFEALGIGIPMITSMNQTKLQTILKVGIIMFIFTKFMDKITSLAASLVGGTEISSTSMGVGDMAKKAGGALRAVQKRGMGAMQKHGIGLAKRGGGAVKSAAQFVGNKGKSTSEGSSGASSVGPKEGGGSRVGPSDAKGASSVKPDSGGASGANAVGKPESKAPTS